jgi:hypothetical protein
VRHRSFAAVAAILLTASGCTGFYEPPVPPAGSVSPSGGPSSSPAPGSPGPTPSDLPDATRTAWENAVSGIERDGRVPLQTALQAFSVVYGQLPGVEMPPGDPAFTGSATGPVRWLLGHWEELTAEQQAAAAKFFDPNVPAAITSQPLAVLGGSVPLGPNRPPKYLSSVEDFKQMAAQLVPRIAAKLPKGRTLKLPYDIVFRDLPVEPGKVVLAVTIPIDTNGQPATRSSTGMKSCLIQVNTRGQQLEVGSEDMTAVTAHELFHCFQYELASKVSDIFNVPPWIDEGGAAWVGEDFTISDVGSSVGQQDWVGWLKEPDTFLFERNYDAIGFYAHLSRKGVDPWKILDRMYIASLKFLASFDAYNIAMQAGGETKAVDNWGPSYLRDDTVGGDWTMAGKGLPTYVKTAIPSGSLGDDDILTMTIAPMQAWAIKLNVTSDVFAFVGPSGRGMVRFSDGNAVALQSALGQPYCIKAGGCACPDGSPGSEFAFQTVASGEVWVGFTGHTDGLDIDIEGFNLPDACEKSPQDLHVPEPCYCGGSIDGSEPAIVRRAGPITG